MTRYWHSLSGMTNRKARHIAAHQAPHRIARWGAFLMQRISRLVGSLCGFRPYRAVSCKEGAESLPSLLYNATMRPRRGFGQRGRPSPCVGAAFLMPIFASLARPKWSVLQGVARCWWDKCAAQHLSTPCHANYDRLSLCKPRTLARILQGGHFRSPLSIYAHHTHAIGNRLVIFGFRLTPCGKRVV